MTDELCAMVDAHQLVLWRLWRSAAVSESRALRLLPPTKWGASLNLVTVVEDAIHLNIREHHNEQVRRRRARKSKP